jgi:hypothetical protein
MGALTTAANDSNQGRRHGEACYATETSLGKRAAVAGECADCHSAGPVA